jgi:succinoglycan biosynthesis transport protein ExoP
MNEGFSIGRNRSNPDGNAALRPASGDNGVLEWDIAESAHEQNASQDATGNDIPPAAPPPVEAATAVPLPFKDLLEEDAEETRSSLPGIDIRRLLLGCWRRRHLVAGIAAAITVTFGILAFATIENQWAAVATLIKRDTSDEFSISGGKAFKPQQYNLQTLLDTLKLPSSLDEVIERAELDMTRTALSSTIDVKLGKESDILHLVVNWEDPQTAARVANHLTDVFLEKSSDMRRADAGETYHYFRERLEETRTERRQIDAEMLAFQQENQLSDFDAETEARLGELARLEGEHQTQQAEINALQFSIERLEAEITGQPDMVIKSTIYRSPLKQRLADYEWELQEARSRYTTDNPKVAKLQKQVDVLTRMINESNDEAVPENTYSPNEHRQDLDLRLHELRDTLKVTENRTAALQTTITAMQQKLAFLSSKEKQFVRLKLRQEASQSLEISLTNRVDESRVQMLRAEPAFDVLERATPPEERQPSGRKLVLAGGAVLGSGLGLLVALLLEFFDPRVRTRRDGTDLSASEVCSEWMHTPAGDRQHVTPQQITSPVVTTFRHFVNNLEALHDSEKLHSIAVVSAERGAGRSLVAANIARTLAMKERPTLLVDADAGDDAGRRPHETCAARGSVTGLLQVLDGTATLKSVLRKTDLQRLHCIGPGAATPGQAIPLLLGGKRMAQFIETLRGFRGRVIYDLPALNSHETALEAAAEVGNVVLVLRSGWSRRSEIRQLVELLQKRRINILGTLVVDVPDHYLEQRRSTSQQHGEYRTTQEENRNGHPDVIQNA